MLALYLSCRRCRQEFRSGVFVAEDRMDGVALHGMLHHCTRCGYPDWYFTSDYHPEEGARRGVTEPAVLDSRALLRTGAPVSEIRDESAPPDWGRSLAPWRPLLRWRL
jgi:hypothetical protein